MDASDMLDVLHYFFEEDTARYTSAEQVDAVSNLRTSIYSNLYDRKYEYGVERPTSQRNPSGAYLNSNTVKPYIPPTDFDADSVDPFGGTLDGPLR